MERNTNVTQILNHWYALDFLQHLESNTSWDIITLKKSINKKINSWYAPTSILQDGGMDRCTYRHGLNLMSPTASGGGIKTITFYK